ncbi:MAG: glycosyltransferase family 4 protein [Minisyncoccota bacterium]
MKILYVANVRIPTEKAHGIQIMKMCEAFAKNGNEIELIVPWRINTISEDPFGYYSIDNKFEIRRIFSLDLVKFGRIGFVIQSLTFALSSFFCTLFSSADIVFGRDELPLFLSSFNKKVVWETHTGSYSLVTKLLLKRCTAIISITQGLKDFYVKNGVNADNIFVSPDAVDLEQFDIDASQTDARKKLNLPLDKKIVLYTGHLYDWKGANTLARSAKFISSDILVVFVGGTEKNVKDFRDTFGAQSNILILGKKPYEDMPMYMKAADVLTLPNSPVNNVSSLYTSPMKLFEYMASGRPIIASDLPSIREVLNEGNALLVKPDEPKLIAEGITKILSNSTFAEHISKRSYSDSKMYTWEKRAESITSFIKA